MIKPRKRLVDTEAVAAHYRVAPGTVRSWASRYGWTPYGTRRARLWDLNQIQKTFDEQETKKAMTEIFEDELAAAAKRRGLPDLPDADLRAVIQTLLDAYAPVLTTLTAPTNQAWLAAAFEAMAGLVDALHSKSWRAQLADTHEGRKQIAMAAGLRHLADAVEKERPELIEAGFEAKEPLELDPENGWRRFEPRGLLSADIKIRWSE